MIEIRQPERKIGLDVYPENPLTGVFATRSPVRPNLIALSLCEIVSIDENVIVVKEIDALPDTPVLDLKPYLPHSETESPRVPDWVRSRSEDRHQ